MKHRFCVPISVAVLLMLLAACQEEMESRSFISKFRILGVQASPPAAVTGDNIEVRGVYAPVANVSARVAFVTVDTQWIAALGAFLPENVDEYSEAELTALLEGFAASGQTSTADAMELLVPQFKVIVRDVDPASGVALLPAENIVVSPALVAVMKLLGQTTGLPLYMLGCSNGTIDEAALLRQVSDLTGSQEIGDMESACAGANATAIASFKTLNILFENDTTAIDTRNENPTIRVFQFDKTIHPPDTPPLDTGKVVCESKDGCRDPIEMKVAVFKEDFQFFEGYSRQQNEMENMFVSWFSDGGEFSSDRIRSDDARAAVDAMADGNVAGMNAILADPGRTHWFTVDWLPPVEGGTFNLWVVVNDLRGGVGYARYRISAEAPNY